MEAALDEVGQALASQANLLSEGQAALFAAEARLVASEAEAAALRASRAELEAAFEGSTVACSELVLRVAELQGQLDEAVADLETQQATIDELLVEVGGVRRGGSQREVSGGVRRGGFQREVSGAEMWRETQKF